MADGHRLPAFASYRKLRGALKWLLGCGGSRRKRQAAAVTTSFTTGSANVTLDDDWQITYAPADPQDPIIAGPRWRAALREIVNVLGPEILDCEENKCDGCKAEAGEALRIAKEALGV